MAEDQKGELEARLARQRLARATALGLLGEGIHTSLRKAGESQWSDAAWTAINEMDGDEWNRVLEFLVDGLESMGVELVATVAPEEEPDLPPMLQVVMDALSERGWKSSGERHGAWSHPDVRGGHPYPLTEAIVAQTFKEIADV